MKLRRICYLLLLILLSAMSSHSLATESLISIKSDYGIAESAERFINTLNKKGFIVFAHIDHSKNAEKVNMLLKPTHVIIFGKPKVGSLLMQCSNTVAIDLPQKILLWQDENKQTWASYNNPYYLKQRHSMQKCDKVLAKIAKALKSITTTSLHK